MIGHQEQRLQYWRDILEKQKLSGLSKKKFCEANAIQYHQFNYYYYKVRPKLPKSKPPEKRTPPKFESLKITQPVTASTKQSNYFCLLLPGNIQCRVPFHFDANSLQRLLGVLTS